MSQGIPPEVVSMVMERAHEIFYQVTLTHGDLRRATVTFVSPQCFRVTGCPPAEFEANPHRWFELVHPEDREDLLVQTEAILASGHEGTRLYRLRDVEGHYRHIEDRVVPMLDGSGRPVGYQGIARDITRRVEAEDQRRRALEALKNAERGEALGRMAAAIGHDFNNILTVILGFSETAAFTLGAEHPVTTELREIDSAVDRGARLVRQLLAFSRRQAVDPQSVDLAAHVSGLDAMLRQAVPESVALQLALERSPWRVFIDPSQVDQIVLNLVANARDAMPEGGVLEVAVGNVSLTPAFCQRHTGAVEGDYVCIGVRDTGVGMTPEIIRHAFVPFFTTKPEGKGTGIGLASVFGIVKQNRGYVLIESEVGHGTTVSVYLPRQAP
ncbi:MAG: PAS domain-containing protein [Acidobacteria bacterium]|nr:PAS domain-containing protein [Acidobacteriota bacterium]